MKSYARSPVLLKIDASTIPPSPRLYYNLHAGHRQKRMQHSTKEKYHEQNNEVGCLNRYTYFHLSIRSLLIVIDVRIS